MGACFSVIFHDCPLHVNSTASWANPNSSRHFLMIGAEEGIFTLDMDELHDAAMVLIHKRRCSWLHVQKNVLMAVQGSLFCFLGNNLSRWTWLRFLSFFALGRGGFESGVERLVIYCL